MGIPCVEPVCQEQCPYFKSLSIGGFAGGTVVKDLTATAGDAGDSGLIAESRRSPGEGNSNSLQYSCLGNPMAEEPSGLQSLGSQSVEHD